MSDDVFRSSSLSMMHNPRKKLHHPTKKSHFFLRTPSKRQKWSGKLKIDNGKLRCLRRIFISGIKKDTQEQEGAVRAVRAGGFCGRVMAPRKWGERTKHTCPNLFEGDVWFELSTHPQGCITLRTVQGRLVQSPKKEPILTTQSSVRMGLH